MIIFLIIYGHRNNNELAKSIYISFNYNEDKYYNYHDHSWVIPNTMPNGTYNYNEYIDKLNLDQKIIINMKNIIKDYTKKHNNDKHNDKKYYIIENIGGVHQIAISC